MDFRHSILIYNLPEAYVKDAVTSISERTTIPEKLIFLVGTDRWGVKLIFENEQNFRKVISLSVLHVRGKKYSLYPLVTDLIVFGKGPQVASSEVELLLERFAPVLIVYEVKNQQDVITFRAALNCPEIPEKIQPWTLQKFNTSGYEGTEFSISPFCRFCKGNGHFKIQCLKRQIPVVREAFGIPSALKQNDNDKKEKEEPRPQSDDQQPINMQSFSHSSFVPLYARTQVYKAPPAFGSHSALKRIYNDEKGKKEFKPQSHAQQHINMQRFPHFSYAALCPQPQKRTALSAFGSPSALKKNDNDKRKKESTPQFDNQQHKNMQSILHSPFAHPQLQPAAPAFGKPFVLVMNVNDEQEKKELMPQKSDDHQQRNMQNILHSTSSPLQPEVPTYGHPRTNQMPQYPKYQSLPNATPLQLDAHGKNCTVTSYSLKNSLLKTKTIYRHLCSYLFKLL
ncbi:unnamed protein product [Larinioides sclopetarius]|uniref:DUF4283 domain-containing protein n=1 Tax=Larinioides sclopetarius TaxID=280406 RepID=A0AAV2A0J9_9ARAC